MREIRTSGSVGAPPGNRRGYPTLPGQTTALRERGLSAPTFVVVYVGVGVVVFAGADADADVAGHTLARTLFELLSTPIGQDVRPHLRQHRHDPLEQLPLFLHFSAREQS